MPRPARPHRSTPARLARLALLAWLTFVVIASVMPFLVSITLWKPQSLGLLGVGGGAVGWWTEHPSLAAQLGGPRSEIRWEPNATNWAFFQFDWFPRGQPAGTKPFVEMTAPPWAVLLVPTLLIVVPRWIRHTIGDRNRRELTARGRTPCPTCGYDATGLAACPECGAATAT